MKNKTLGERINYYRQLKGYTAKELGKLLGVSGATVSQWQANKTSPRPDKVQELANIFNIDVTELLEGRENTTLILRRDNNGLTFDKKAIEEFILQSIEKSNQVEQIIKLFATLDVHDRQKVIDGIIPYFKGNDYKNLFKAIYENLPSKLES